MKVEAEEEVVGREEVEEEVAGKVDHPEEISSDSLYSSWASIIIRIIMNFYFFFFYQCS